MSFITFLLLLVLCVLLSWLMTTKDGSHGVPQFRPEKRVKIYKR